MKNWIYIFIVGALSVSVTKGCYELQKCLTSPKVQAIVTKYQADGKVNFDGDKLNQICNDIQPMQTCIARNLGSCGNEVITAALQSIYNLFDYLCNEGKQDYMKHAKCYTKESVSTKLESCKADLKRGEADLKSKVRWGTVTKSELKSQTCQYMNQYLNCVDTSVRGECGEEAGKTLKTLIDNSLKPMMDLLECNKNNQTAIIIGCVVGVIALLVIIAIVYVWHRRKKSAAGQRAGEKYGHV